MRLINKTNKKIIINIDNGKKILIIGKQIKSIVMPLIVNKKYITIVEEDMVGGYGNEPPTRQKGNYFA
jgi:hypothetical protein